MAVAVLAACDRWGKPVEIDPGPLLGGLARDETALLPCPRAILAIIALVPFRAVVSIVAVGALGTLLPIAALGAHLRALARSAIVAIIAARSTIAAIAAVIGRHRILVVLFEIFAIFGALGALLLEACAAFVEDAEIMVRELEVIFGLDAVARELRIARHRLVFLMKLGGVPALADILPIAAVRTAADSLRPRAATAATATVLSVVDQAMSLLMMFATHRILPMLAEATASPAHRASHRRDDIVGCSGTAGRISCVLAPSPARMFTVHVSQIQALFG